MFKSLKYLLVGGDKLSPKHINKVIDKNKDLKIINGYGPTENTITTTAYLNADYKNVSNFRLEQNYRSTEAILNTANRLIVFNSKRHDKVLRAARPGTRWAAKVHQSGLLRMQTQACFPHPPTDGFQCLPGGCAIGARPMDLHIHGLEAMGAEFKFSHGYVEARADRLHGAEITFDFPSVGATENLTTAAVLADGVTTIEEVVRESVL